MSTTQKDKELVSALRRLEILKKGECFDPFDLDSRANNAQELVLRDTTTLHRYVVAGNQSGKTQLGAREISWVFLENHPWWNREMEGWGKEPLEILVVGRIHEQVEAIWENKIKPFLPEGSYKAVKIGQQIKRVINLKSGNTIRFLSHDKAQEAAQKIQSFVCHWVWLDEMPSSEKFIEELHRRVDAKQGKFIATFTPKVRNDKIRDMVDNADGSVAKKFRMSKLDNPIYKGREEIELAKLKGMPDALKRTILYGDWSGGDKAVYDYDANRNFSQLPKAYNTQWDHVAGIDPAASGNTGLCVLARDPSSHFWYIVKSEYITGRAPTELIEEVERQLRPYNIVRRVADTHETWFIKESSLRGITWMGVWNKAQRKTELITKLQQALLDGWLKATPLSEKFTREVVMCEWSMTKEDTIANSTKYHILDSMQYVLDNIPKFSEPTPQLSFDQQIRVDNRARKVGEQSAKKTKLTKGRKLWTLKQRSRWR
jgi:phage terminase large subunit-like protein